MPGWTLLLAQDEAAAAAATGFMGLFCCIWVFAALVGIASFAIWVWMLIDCITNEPSEGNDKVIWLLIILLLHGLGAVLYYFIRRPQRIEKYGK